MASADVTRPLSPIAPTETKHQLQGYEYLNIRQPLDLKAAENFKSDRVASTMKVSWNFCYLEDEPKSPYNPLYTDT